MVRHAYDWCLAAAHKPYALWLMGLISFAESSFFPIPPDTMLIPMSLARPEKAWTYAALCTLTSVAGGILGYAIGALLYDTLGHWLISAYGYGGKVEAFREQVAAWGAWIIVIKGLTPIPYKVVTIALGIAGYSLWSFILLSLLTRGARFFLIAFLFNRYGDAAREIIEKRLGFWLLLSALIIIVGIFAALYLF
jgi:membrane protein YqaA with SNARE-associated domain